jgi:hypothetical protein
MRMLPMVGVIGGLAVVGLSITMAMNILPKSTPSIPSQTANSSLRIEAKETKAHQDGGLGLEALEQAAQAKKYLFAFFWKDESDVTLNRKKVFEKAMRKVVDRANSVQVLVSDPSENGIVEKFGLDHAPMPLVLAIAPNGAVMGGFPEKFTEEEIINAFGSPCTEQCLKTLQDGNLVLLCIQNGSTASNEEAMKGVQEFASDQRYANATKIVMLDPSDPVEKPFLTDLKIDSQSDEAITAFLVPPGSLIAEFKGATNKEDFIDTLQKANTGCGTGGCGPGGCGPKK